jgi:dolichyl-phosphate-mannose--protein O-mannosyl transferase
MNTQQNPVLDEQTTILLRGIGWAYNFIAFAILIDIMYRSLFFHEAPWDLFALLIGSGVISLVYAARHKALVSNRKFMTLMAVVALVAAIVAFILGATKVM